MTCQEITAAQENLGAHSPETVLLHSWHVGEQCGDRTSLVAAGTALSVAKLGFIARTAGRAGPYRQSQAICGRILLYEIFAALIPNRVALAGLTFWGKDWLVVYASGRVRRP